MRVERSGTLASAGFTHGFGTRHASRADGPRVLYTLRQVHGDAIAHIAPPLPHRRWRFAQADAIVTCVAGVGVGVRTADCLPVLLADAVGGGVGAAHCGWRSLALGLLGGALTEMGRLFSTRPEDVLAVLGPSIRSCCYQVGPEVRAAFAGHPGSGAFVGDGMDLKLDLERAARAELMAHGVCADRIETVGGCTRCRPDLYFSWRGERARDRMVNWISVKGPASR